MLKVGIIGGGMVADGHIAGMMADPRVDLVGVADPNPQARERVASQFGAAVFEGHEQLVERSDLLYLCIPHVYHHPVALECISAGKHVICEKPFAMNAAEARNMLDAANRAGVQVFVAENFRYVPELFKARQMLLANEIGKPILCGVSLIGDELERMSDPNSWKGTPEVSGGGSIIDQGPHTLDSLYWLFGEVDKISAFGDRLVVPAANKAEDAAQIIAQFKSGMLACCTVTFAAKYNGFPEGYCGFGCRYDINATGGSIHFVFGQGLTIVKPGGTEHIRSTDIGMPSMDRDFVSSVLGEGEALVSGEDGLYVMRMIDACYASIRESRAITI